MSGLISYSMHRKPFNRMTLRYSSITNACGHAHHGHHDVHGRVLLHCQREHVRENGHGRVHGYAPSQNREYAGECAGADVRVYLA